MAATDTAGGRALVPSRQTRTARPNEPLPRTRRSSSARTTGSAAPRADVPSPSGVPVRPPRLAVGGGARPAPRLTARDSPGTPAADARRRGRGARRAAASPHSARPALPAACLKAAAGSWCAWPTAGQSRVGARSCASPSPPAPPVQRSDAGAGSYARAGRSLRPVAS
jgi:hypothetical protein